MVYGLDKTVVGLQNFTQSFLGDNTFIQLPLAHGGALNGHMSIGIGEIDPNAPAPLAQVILNDSVQASSVVISIVPSDFIGMFYLFGDPGGAGLFGGYMQNEGNNVVGVSWTLDLQTLPAGYGAASGFFRYWMLHPAQR